MGITYVEIVGFHLIFQITAITDSNHSFSTIILLILLGRAIIHIKKKT